MVFSDEDKAIIKNDYEEKGWSAYRIWKEHPAKGWVESSVRRLIRKFEATGSMDRRSGSGRPRTATTEENAEVVEELISSQEEPGTHTHPRTIAEELDISHTSVRRIIDEHGYNQFKTPSSNEGTRARRLNRSEALVEDFTNPRKIERLIFQDEKDFPLEIPINAQNSRVYFKGRKADVPTDRLCHQTKRLTKKVMLSAGLSWFGATKPFFVNDRGLKVDSKNYVKHLRTELFPAIKQVYPRDDWIYAQDGATSHTANITQDYLKETLGLRFIMKSEWPPASPDTNPLDYYFWNAVKEKVYEGRMGRPFNDESELKQKIRSVWNECATNTEEIRKAFRQFVPRLRAVVDKDGYSIKMVYG